MLTKQLYTEQADYHQRIVDYGVTGNKEEIIAITARSEIVDFPNGGYASNEATIAKRIDQNGNVLSKKSYTGNSKLFYINDIPYIAHYSIQDQKLYIYNEKLEEIQSVSIPAIVQADAHVEMYVQEDKIAIAQWNHITSEYEYHYYNSKTQSLYDETETYPSAFSLTYHDDQADDNQTMLFNKTFAGEVIDAIAVDHPYLSSSTYDYFYGDDEDFVSHNGYLYQIIVVNKNSSNDFYLVKINQQGEVEAFTEIQNALFAKLYAVGSNIHLSHSSQHSVFNGETLELINSHTSGEAYEVKPFGEGLALRQYIAVKPFTHEIVDENGNVIRTLPTSDRIEHIDEQIIVTDDNFVTTIYDYETGDIVDSFDNYISVSNGVIIEIITHDNGTYNPQPPKDLTYYLLKQTNSTEDGRVEATKNWRVKLNLPVDRNSVTEQSIKVVDELNDEVKGITFSFEEDDTVIVVNAPNAGYESGKTYTLIIDQSVRSATTAQNLKETVTKDFTVK